MTKTKLGSVPWVYPIPIVLVGANVDGKPNFAEVGDCAIMGIRPAMVAVSLGEAHHTTRGVDAAGAFSINLPSTQLLSLTDLCGMVSGKDVDKSGLFTVFEGEQTRVPMIEECPVNLECNVQEVVQIRHRRMFIADVVECHVSEEFTVWEEGKPRVADLPTLDPILYSLDNCYYRVGDAIGTGCQEGVRHKLALDA